MSTNNEPAFPLAPVGTGDPRDGMAGGSVGMSKLELVAAMALQGILSNPTCNGKMKLMNQAAIEHAEDLLEQLAGRASKTP